ncbi:MAG: hypothetical protein VYC34_08490 [Planctomycetota bacterium]|nr:hypothetical protein [Planctomycetota bacterium]
MSKQVETNEEYRKAAHFLARAMSERSLRAAVITGARPGDGATTAAVRIADLLARDLALKTALVELPRSSPDLATLLNLDASRSVEAAAAGDQPLDDCLQRPSPTGAWILPSAGNGPAAPSVESLVTKVLGLLASFDIVLFDAPPALRSVDALAATRIAPALVLVVRAGRTRHEMIERIRRDFEEQKVEILGAVLNRRKRYIPGWLYGLLAR